MRAVRSAADLEGQSWRGCAESRRDARIAGTVLVLCNEVGAAEDLYTEVHDGNLTRQRGVGVPAAAAAARHARRQTGGGLEGAA